MLKQLFSYPKSGSRTLISQLRGIPRPSGDFPGETGVSSSGFIGHSSFFELAKPTNLGLLFPGDHKITPELLRHIDHLLDQCAVRVIPEVMMPENWDGLDGLIAFKEAITDFGRRVLSGFEATGGSVYTAVSDSASLRRVLSDFFSSRDILYG